MKWELVISLRYLFERRRERFISVTAFISIMGIAVGVAALIVTMGIVNGFNHEIEEKILNVYPHIIIGKAAPFAYPKELVDAVMKIDGVEKSAEYLDGQAVINVDENITGVLIRGIEPNRKERLIDIDNLLVEGSASLKGNSAVIGSELAHLYRLNIGDSISIISPVSGGATQFRVGGIFNSGRYDYDLQLVFIGIGEARGILAKKDKEDLVSAVALKVRDAFAVDRIKRDIRRVAAPVYQVRTWKDIERNLFSALRLEKIVMFIVVALIVFVACFNIISTLIMTVMEKTKDIGVLKAIGVTRFGVMSVFLLEGLYISLLGIIAGTGLGLGICYLQDKYKLVKLPPDVYYIYNVPVQVRMPDTLMIITAAAILGLAATVYPSLHAARLDPVEALRCE